MSNIIPEIPEPLIKALIDKTVVPFIGAGVSRAVEKKEKDLTKDFNPLFPNWKEFLDYSVEKLKSKKEFDEAEDIEKILSLKQPMYLEVARRASKTLGETLWHQMLKAKLDRKKSDANEDSLKLPKLVWELGSNLLITTNVDRVLQWTCPNSAEFRPLDLENYELGKLQKEKEVEYPTVLYLHGRIHSLKNVVFTPEQYKGFYEDGNNQAKLQTLVNTLTKFTTLFIGFSLDDEYFLRQLNKIDDIYDGGADSFYFLLPEGEENNPNIPEYVEKITYAHHGKPLLDLIERMKRIANGEDDSDSLVPSSPPEPPPIDSQLQITTASKSFGTTSSTQKLFKSVLAEKHFNVPFASKGEAFVGREGLREKIWDSLNQSGRAAIGQAVSIEGFGGLGKTQLAVEYAHAYRDRYKNGIYWLTADENIDIQLIKIGEELNWISQFDKGFDQAELVRNRFRKLSDCLIIFDNVDKQHSIEDYLPEKDAQPHILVTSREEQDGYYPVSLDILSFEEARELLIKIADREPNSETEAKALENILAELDGLPLAVELVGGYLKRRDSISFQDYYGFLQNEPLERLEKKFPDKTFTKHNKSIIRTLKISEAVLDETKYLEEILDILAWSGKSSMGYSLLRKLVGSGDNFALQDALGVALELRFLKQEEDAERFAIHRLLARVRQFERPLHERRNWHQNIVNNLADWFHKRKDEFKFLTEFEAEVIHLQQWQSQSSSVFPIETIYLTDFEAYPLWHRGNYRESKILLETALDLYQKNKLDDKKLLANLYNDLGVITESLGNIKQGFELEQKALSIGRNVFDEKSEEIAKFLGNLSRSYSVLGDYQKALELEQQTLEISLEIFGERHEYVATSLNSLGSTYAILGKYQKAFELIKQALEIRLELFGEKHPNVAFSLSTLGSAYDDLENHKKALELKQQALEIRIELFGEKHPDVASSLNSLDLTYSGLGNYKKALELQQQALEIRLELFGEKHPDVASSLKNLGMTYDDLGDHKKALKLQQQALEIRLELFGKKHPEVASSLSNIGYTYSRLKDRGKAIEAYQIALKTYRELLGEKYPETVTTCHNLIDVLNAIGKTEQAGRLAGEFLSYVPSNHPDRKFFEKHGAAYRKAKQRKKKRRH